MYCWFTPTPAPTPTRSRFRLRVTSPSRSLSLVNIHERADMQRRQPPRRYACSRCVQLKVKCVPVAGRCQRCIRLDHPSCVFPANVRTKDTQTSHLEGSTPGQTHENGALLYGLLDIESANQLLLKYRAQMMPQFPFVIVPPEEDLQSLRQRFPFLLLCILTASLEHDPSLQAALEAHIRQEVANRLIVQTERSMDLLQGLLVHVAWYHYHWRTYHSHVYMLLQMAIVFVEDLGLDRQQAIRMQETPAEGKGKEHCRGHKAAGQRALVGCYYLCFK